MSDDNSSGTGVVSSKDNNNDDGTSDDENETNGVWNGLNLNPCQWMSEINCKTITQSHSLDLFLFAYMTHSLVNFPNPSKLCLNTFFLNIRHNFAVFGFEFH